MSYSVANARAVHGVAVSMQLARSRELTQNGQYTTRSVNVFHVIQRCAGSNLAQLRHIARKRVDVSHCEIKLGFLRSGKQVQNGVG